MIVYTVNSYLQNDVDLQTLMGGSFFIKPYSGDVGDTSPVLSYEWRPNIFSQDAFYMHNDIFVYSVADIDIDRAFKIRQKIIDLMNIGNSISNIQDPDNQFSWSFLIRSTDYPAKEKEGFYELDCYFEVGYRKLS